MASNRADLLQQSHKTLKKHFKAVTPNDRLPIFEQLIFGCCLEDATHDAALQAFAKLEEQFFDWNEVRVSTVTELSEAMGMVPHPRGAAKRVKRVLQSVFEDAYAFDLEKLKRQNIGVAVKTLATYDGTTRFTVAHVTQTSLGGHAIPVGDGALDALVIVGVITEKEKASGTVPGLERAIPKNKGIEFGSLLNQMGIELQRAPFAPGTRNILIEITPDAKERLPKRRPKAAVPAKSSAKSAAKSGAKTAAKPATKAPTKSAAKSAAKSPKKSAKPAAKVKVPPKKKPTKKTVTIKRKKVVAKKGAAKKGTPVKKKRKVVKAKSSASKRITRRKPK